MKHAADAKRARMHVGLSELRQRWERAIGRQRWLAVVGAGLLIIVATAWIARTGLPLLRGLAALLLLLTASFGVWALARERRIWRDAPRTLLRVASGAPREIRDRAARAWNLHARLPAGSSAELAAAYANASLAELAKPAVDAARRKLGKRVKFAGAGLLLLGVGACATQPVRTFEGFDVLLAQGGVAPIAMGWVATPTVNVNPPAYLHEATETRAFYTKLRVAHGSTLTLGGTAVHAGRELFLSDGKTTYPITYTAAGEVQASLVVDHTTTLRMYAQFGAVRIEDDQVLELECIEDAPPQITLKDAPRTIKLSELTGAEGEDEIALEYQATDDHGLREIDVAFEIAGQTERRRISKLDGDARVDRGAFVLRLSDPLIRKAVMPIRITIDARDNDPVTGPKWGQSAALTIVPPDIAERQAARLRILRALRDDLTDALAARMAPIPALATERAEFVAAMNRQDRELRARQTQRVEHMQLALSLRVRALLDKRATKTQSALLAASKDLSAARQKTLLAASERELLVVDATIASIGNKDTLVAAAQLAVVASKLAEQFDEIGRQRGPSPPREQISAMFALLLKQGGTWMRELGALGRDLGEIVDADFARIERARGNRDWPHAKLAALDLAARLGSPNPSFGAKGGGGGSPEGGGGEADPNDDADGEGDAKGDGEDGEGSPESEVSQATRDGERELEQLAQDHAGEVAKLENERDREASASEAKSLQNELLQRAEAIAKSTARIPSGGPESAALGDARKQADAMKEAVERGKLREAVARGREAQERLAEVGRAGQNAERKVQDEARETAEEFAEHAAFAEKKLAELRAARGASGAHAEDALRERGLARQMGKTRRGEGSKGTTSKEAKAALGEAESDANAAADALSRGNLDAALAAARAAQTKLERARSRSRTKGGKEGEASGAEGNRDSNAADPEGHAEIPDSDAHKSPTEFRRRVMDGLSAGERSKWRDSIRRYSEGLLR